MPRSRDRKLLGAIGQRVGQMRRDRAWTQERLSEAIGIQAISLSRLETGSRALSLSTLALLADALEVGLGDLLDVDRPVPQVDRLPGEAELIQVFRGLDDEKRELLLRLARDVAR